MIFHFYLAAILTAVALSLSNLWRGDIRLTGLAIGYLAIISGFHLAFAREYPELEFYALVAGAQGVIAYVAYMVRCRASRLVMPLAWAAIVLNAVTLTLEARYPHAIYYYSMNLIQCLQIGALIAASSVWQGIASLILQTIRKKNKSMQRIAHERTG